MRRPLVFALALALAAVATTVPAADDPSIQEPLRGQIQTAMQALIDDATIDGAMRLYDPLTDDVLTLADAELHAGIVKKGDFFVSCADFTDQQGRTIDVDFLVLPDGGEVRAVQAIVHKVDGTKRPYHLDD